MRSITKPVAKYAFCGFFLAFAHLCIHANQLAERSPFLPPGFVPPDAATTTARPAAPGPGPLSSRLEFRGVYEIEGEYRFLISDRRTRNGSWVTLNDPQAQYLVRSFDSQSQTIVVRFENAEDSLTIERMDPNFTPMPVAVAAPTQQPGAAAAQRPGQQGPQRPAAARPRRPATVAGAAGADQPAAAVAQSAAERAQTAGANRNLPANIPPPPSYVPPPPPNLAPPTPPPAMPPGATSPANVNNPQQRQPPQLPPNLRPPTRPPSPPPPPPGQ